MANRLGETMFPFGICLCYREDVHHESSRILKLIFSSLKKLQMTLKVTMFFFFFQNDYHIQIYNFIYFQFLITLNIDYICRIIISIFYESFRTGKEVFPRVLNIIDFYVSIFIFCGETDSAIPIKTVQHHSYIIYVCTFS